jgi:hypothetical protein
VGSAARACPQHKEACCSILEFLVQLMNRSGSYQTSIPPTIHAVGQRFMHLLVASAAGGLPISRLEDVGDVLTTLVDEKCSAGEALPWLQVSSLP